MAKSKAGTIKARVDLDGVVWADLDGYGPLIGYENNAGSGVIDAPGIGLRSVLVAHATPGDWTLRLIDHDDKELDSDTFTV